MNTNMRVLVFCTTVLLCCRYAYCRYDLPGETSPASVEIEVGDSVNISCRMNPEFFEDRTVRDLYFVNTITHQRVSNAEIAIINEDTIVFMLKNANESKSTYCCMCGSDAIMETRVYVGHKPQPVTNFTCRSYNFEHMKCNFTKPENYVLTQYNVTYHFDLKAYYKYTPVCDFKKSPLVTTCTAFETYHSNENIFHYEIVATNSLGTITQRFDIDSMSVMVLATPQENFSVRQLTADSATFTFRFKNYSRGLQWEVILQPRNLRAIELTPRVHPIPISNNEFELNLKNLSFAYYEYRIGLRVRLSAVNSWSEPFNYWFRTLSRIPDRPPRIDVGAFETDASDELIRLYWETLQPYEYNGDNFDYVVEQLGVSEPKRPVIMDSNSAVFLWKKELQYVFSIRSRNHEGMSKVATRITIPAMTSDIHRKNSTPPAVYSIYHENTSAFTITWIAPKNVTNLLDYTVFWCRKRSLLLNVCEGSIHFERVPRDVNQFTTPPQEHTLSMAVSANYENFNTGLHWTECTMSEKTDLIKMEPKVEATSETSIKIEWGTGNICPSILEGYNLSYCAVDMIGFKKSDIKSYNCISDGPAQHISINKTFKRWELQHLKPFTIYKIEMFMYAKHKFGKKSNSQLVRTWESAPSEPLQLNVSHITNTSAIISWLPPSEPNGIVRSYIIVQNNESIEIPPTIDESSGRIVHKLENLSISTLYILHVIAQTGPDLRSQPSNTIEFRTLVGYPSMPGPVSLNDSKNDAQIVWVTPPGRTDFYEISLTLLKGDELMSRRISIVIGANSCAFRIPKCFDHEYRTTVDVRSVNAASLLNEVDDTDVNDNSNLYDGDSVFYDGDDELSCIVKNTIIDAKQKELLELYSNNSAYRLYKSAWQRGPIFSCAASVLGTIMLYVTLPTFFIGCLVMSLYFMRQKYNKMANIHCTLPAALDAYMTKDISGVSTTLSHNFNMNSTDESEKNQSSNINTNIQDNNLTQNEELCLLEATSQNSFLMNDHHIQQLDFPQCDQSFPQALLEEDNSVKNSEISSDSEANDNNDYLNVNSRKNFNPTTTANNSPAYVQACDILNQNQHNGFVSILPVNNSYIKTNAMTNWQNITENQTPDYVSAESITTKPRTENILELQKKNTQTSYVSASDLVPSTNNGYTTIEQLNKLSSFSPNNISNRNEMLPVNDRPAISGYVTPRELTAFGQQQQHHFS